MERGLYIAASGMLAEQVRQDQLANDLANVSTPGYKADRVSQQSFATTLDLVNRQTGTAVGALGAGSQIATIATDLSPEVLKDTGEPLDLAISGEGFFAVRTAQGVRYTRDGSFAADAQGRLVDQAGALVLGKDRRPVTVGTSGSVDVSAVGVFALRDARKMGDGHFSGTTTAGTALGTVRSGALEMAGVDASRTMVDMIGSLRAFEAGQRAITTIDETLRLATGQVGNLPG
jgi:flagellar basal-body rod protein FlgG